MGDLPMAAAFVLSILPVVVALGLASRFERKGHRAGWHQGYVEGYRDARCDGEARQVLMPDGWYQSVEYLDDGTDQRWEVPASVGRK